MKKVKWNYQIVFSDLKLMNSIAIFVKDDSFIYENETQTMNAIYLLDTCEHKWVQIVHNGDSFVNTGNVYDNIGSIGVDKFKIIDFTQKVLNYL